MTNCYVIACPETKEAVIIDAGDEPLKILDIVDDEGLTLKHLINTHVHIDHVSAVSDIQKDDMFRF